MNFGTKLGYGIGQFSEGVKQTAFSTFLFFFYNQVLGLSASLAGLAALIALLVDAISDPIVGRWSDRLKSKWGRRHPLMAAAIVPYAITMYLLFTPPEGLSQLALFSWMLGFAIVLRIALTLFFVPHLSLGAEIAKGYHERTGLIGYRVFFTYAGILLVSVIGFTMFFPKTEQYSNGLLNASAYPAFGMFCAILGAAAMLLSTLSTRKLIPTLAQVSDEQLQSKQSVWLAVVDVFKGLKQRAFKIIFFGSLYFNALAGLIQTLLIYIATYIFGFTAEMLAVLSLALILAIFIAPTLAKRVSNRMGKKQAASVAVVIGALLGVMPTLTYLAGSLDTMQMSTKLIYIFVLNGLSQGFFIAFVILVDSMLTDTIDEHLLKTGKREEGLFFAARAFATKASYGLGAFLAGIVLEIIQFPKEADPSMVSGDAVQNLALFAGPGMLILFSLTVLIIRFFPISKADHDHIMAELKKKQMIEA